MKIQAVDGETGQMQFPVVQKTHIPDTGYSPDGFV
jgi:hypothetical protein